MDPPSSIPETSQSHSSSPKLERLDPSTRHAFREPSKCINQESDVARFLVSKAYRDIGTFVLQLNRAVCPRKKPNAAAASGAALTFTLSTPRNDPPSVTRLQELLRRVSAIIEEAPPDPGPRRFGNVSFRTWSGLLQERADDLLREFVAPGVVDFGAGAGEEQQPEQVEGERAIALDELKSYFLGSFGSAQRLDYGTGHELSFVAFLGGLWKLGAFDDGAQGGDVERSLVLGVIEP